MSSYVLYCHYSRMKHDALSLLPGKYVRSASDEIELLEYRYIRKNDEGFQDIDPDIILSLLKIYQRYV